MMVTRLTTFILMANTSSWWRFTKGLRDLDLDFLEPALINSQDPIQVKQTEIITFLPWRGSLLWCRDQPGKGVQPGQLPELVLRLQPVDDEGGLEETVDVDVPEGQGVEAEVVAVRVQLA